MNTNDDREPTSGDLPIPELSPILDLIILDVEGILFGFCSGECLLRYKEGRPPIRAYDEPEGEEVGNGCWLCGRDFTKIGLVEDLTREGEAYEPE